MTNKLTAALAGGALLASTIFAIAGEGQGVIASIDPETRMIVLEDGSSWLAADEVVLAGLAPGDTISVVYTDGTTTLTEVTKVE
ncbi:DUF1344 domain-containing protein [Oceaniradius stylonematis]|jgi:hypothetical protein|uniref:DUF1344 domain-containing protein n=1 Tax=Oceaniradius stylonematis TaxID=2184161 RepID=UPI0035CF2198